MCTLLSLNSDTDFVSELTEMAVIRETSGQRDMNTLMVETSMFIGIMCTADARYSDSLPNKKIRDDGPSIIFLIS